MKETEPRHVLEGICGPGKPLFAYNLIKDEEGNHVDEVALIIPSQVIVMHLAENGSFNITKGCWDSLSVLEQELFAEVIVRIHSTVTSMRRQLFDVFPSMTNFGHSLLFSWEANIQAGLSETSASILLQQIPVPTRGS